MSYHICSVFIFFTVFIVVQYITSVSAAGSVTCVGYCTTNCNCTTNFTYQCKNGQCIHLSKWRNSQVDCDDESDEWIDCCPEQFKCDTRNGIGKCLEKSLVDNGKTECLDGTDESTNNVKTCDHFKGMRSIVDTSVSTSGTNAASYYQCPPAKNGSKYGKCINVEKVMDGNEDCPHAEDEDAKNFNLCLLPHVSRCHDDSTCVNLGGGNYTCNCHAGFTGDGYDCKPIAKTG